MKRADFSISDGLIEWRINPELLDQIRDGLQIMRDGLANSTEVDEVVADDGQIYKLVINLYPKGDN